jgi:putative endopeptidase
MKRSILAAMLLATTAGGVAVWQAPALAQAVTGTKSGVDKSLIDQNAKPGDDFNAYANGAWLKTAEIPADRSSIGVGLDVFKVAESRNQAATCAASPIITTPITIPPRSRRAGPPR